MASLIKCPIKLTNWNIDCTSHQYSDSSPILCSSMEYIGLWMSEPRSDITQLLMQVVYNFQD